MSFFSDSTSAASSKTYLVAFLNRNLLYKKTGIDFSDKYASLSLSPAFHKNQHH